jgi:hypothetical protein
MNNRRVPSCLFFFFFGPVSSMVVYNCDFNNFLYKINILFFNSAVVHFVYNWPMLCFSASFLNTSLLMAEKGQKHVGGLL